MCRAHFSWASVDNKLIALDAKTGEGSCRSFGIDGAVDLMEGIGNFTRGWMNPTSPPTIVHGTAR